MIEHFGNIPRKVTLAFSGGVDSVAVADFLKNNHDVTLLFVHHGTEDSGNALTFVTNYAISNNLRLKLRYIDTNKPKRKSQEEWWRIQRYEIFNSIDDPVITCHHLDDVVETWLFTSMNGLGKLIPKQNLNVIRPFLRTRKQDFIDWCTRRNLSWCEDSSNKDTKHTRNYIRHEMMPHVLRINPGIHKTIKKMYK